VEGEIRRMRLKLDGFVYNPKFGYKVELGFSARDIGTVVVGNSGNVILDGVFFYKPTSDFTIGFGQTKLPGNKRVISSNSLRLRIVVSITQSLISTVILDCFRLFERK
jgi:hypothetical protein